MPRTSNSLAVGDAATQVAERKSFSIGVTGALVAAIILLECATIYAFLAGRFSFSKAEVQRAVAADEHVQWRDVDLGKFSLTAFDPKSSGSLLIEFHLFGSVAEGNSAKELTAGAERDGIRGLGSKSSDATEDDNLTFEKLFQRETGHFRDQVIGIVGSAEISALSEPSFGVIKRQILARTNSLLGKPLLKEIRFSDFAVVQQ